MPQYSRLIAFAKIIAANFRAGAHTPQDCCTSLENSFAMHKIQCKVRALRIDENGRVVAAIAPAQGYPIDNLDEYCSRLNEALDGALITEPHEDKNN